MSPAFSSSARICLDFGTSFSKASLYLPEGSPWRSTKPLQLGAASGADNAWLTPSVMFVDEGRIRIGPPALRAAALAAARGRDPILSFKTIFAARDLEGALALKVKRSIDPSGTLTYRDAVVLYLAHLDQLTRAALARESGLPQDALAAARRYTTPIWRRREEADRSIGRLFDEAAAVSERLGPALVSHEGVSIAQAGDGLERARETLGIGQLETGVFEAHAAAAAYAACKENPARCFLLVDMGAGTTDLAGFEHETGQFTVMSEIAKARQSCGLAGDELDQILTALLADKKRLHSSGEQAALWRGLQLEARTLKRDLFEHGKCSFTQPGLKLSASRGELTGSKDYRALARALCDIIEPSLAAVTRRAGELGVEAVTVLLAGGGANTSLLKDAVKQAIGRQRSAITIERLGEGFRLPPNSDAGMQASLPQLAISMGGALAHIEAGAEPALQR